MVLTPWRWNMTLNSCTSVEEDCQFARLHSTTLENNNRTLFSLKSHLNSWKDVSFVDFERYILVVIVFKNPVMADNITQLPNASDLNVTIKIGLVALVPGWCRTVLSIYMCIVFSTGLPGNIIVLLVQAKIQRKTTTDWLVAFLAVCDIISLIVCIPVYMIITQLWWSTIGSTAGCRFHNFIIHLTFIASTLLITCIGLDRFWKTKSHIQMFSPIKSYYTAIGIFGFSVILGVMAAFSTKNNSLGHCIYEPSERKLQLILYLMVTVTITASTTTICVSYIRIVQILKSKMKIQPGFKMTSAINTSDIRAPIPANHYEAAVRTTKLMFLVTVVFLVSTIIPTIAVVSLTATEFRNSPNGRIVIFFLTRLYLINNCANPFFYIGLNNAFRKRTRALLKKPD